MSESIDESNMGGEHAIDMDTSFSEYTVDVKPPVLSLLQLQQPPSTSTEQKQKPEELPVKQRKTGTISVRNLARRRLLSVSAENASAFFRQQQNQSPSPRRIPHAPVRHTTTKTICVRPTIQNQPAPMDIENSPPAQDQNQPQQSRPSQQQQQQQQRQQSPPVQLQRQQQQQLSQQVLELVRLAKMETFCLVCQAIYSSRQGLKQHQKSQKHQNNIDNMDQAQQQLLNQVYALARANHA